MLSERETPERLAHALAQARARAAFLEHAIRTVVEGEHFILGHLYRADGKPSKHDTCVHGQARFQGCEACTLDFLSRALKGVSSDGE